MVTYRRRGHLRRTLSVERFEPRHCLSAVTFAAHEIEADSAPNARYVHTADLDGDGDLDVLAASGSPGTLAWYENTDGEGRFELKPAHVIATDGLPSLGDCLNTADLDGDGDLDVLAVFNIGPFNSIASSLVIAWYENTDGKGNFGPQQAIWTWASYRIAYSAYPADLDGDGDLDILTATDVGNNNSTLAWHENLDGKGNFGSQERIIAGLYGVNAISAGDFDGDDDVDVLAATWEGPNYVLSWYQNWSGEGNFVLNQVIDTGLDGHSVRSVAKSDMDGDGDLDVLAAFTWSANDGEIAWYENTDGKGSFGQRRTIAVGVEVDFPSMYVADLDRDGDLDVLAASRDCDSVAWYENTDGAGNFGPQQVITSEANGAWSVHAGDLDGDGDLDVLSASTSDDKIAWYENTDGQGTFGPQQLISTVVDSAMSSHASDVDGDGDLDLLVGFKDDDGSGGHVAWYENTDGQGSFGPQQVISTEADYARSVYAGDLDGDGDPDVLSASMNDNKIAWYENTDGQGNFGPQQVISSKAGSARAVYAVDLDGDSDLDVLSASFDDDKIAWYENAGEAGTFGPERIITSAADGAESVYAADLDSDGDFDVLSASYNDDKIAWYENTDGKGSFGPQQVISRKADSARSVYAADLDGDGDLDVLSASSNDDEIVWYENTNGGGSFGPQQVISIDANGAYYVYAADLDGDGDQDVLSASIYDDKIDWYENTNGQGNFGPQQVISSTNVGTTGSVCVADLDGDGDPDVVPKAVSRVVWFENLLPHPGDANRDGRFDTADLVQVLEAGEYEDDIEDNSSWEEGDWDGDGDFGTADLVLALQTGLYEVKSGLNASKVAAAVDWLFTHSDTKGTRRAFVA